MSASTIGSRWAYLDYWIKVIKERRDESWSLAELYGAMLNRRRDENHVAYVESHDQALVGDQTIAFRLMGAEMYWHMQKGDRAPGHRSRHRAAQVDPLVYPSCWRAKPG